MKKIALITLLLLGTLQGLGNAAFIPLNLADYTTLNGSLATEFGRQPGAALGGVPFSFPAATADFFAFNNGTGNALTMDVDIARAGTAYLLINTNWGQYDFLTGRVTFKTVGNRTYSLDLVGGMNIRDWNQDRYTNTVSSPTNTPTGFTADPDMWGSQGRIDLLTVQLPEEFFGDTLDSITFLDFGTDGSTSSYGGTPSRIRIEGVTVGTVPVPEPASLLLVFAGLALMAGKWGVGRFRKI
jgi:hypothetical protein